MRQGPVVSRETTEMRAGGDRMIRWPSALNLKRNENTMKKLLAARLPRYIALGLSAAVIVPAITATPVQAQTGPVRVNVQVKWTGGIGVWARHAPTLTAPKENGPGEGATYGIICQTSGSPVGPRSNRIWNKASWNGKIRFFPDEYSNSPMPPNVYWTAVPRCSDWNINPPAPTPPPTTVAPTPPPALTVGLSENPYVCDNGVRQMGTIGNAAAGESIGFTSPGLSLLSGAANGAGQLSIKWQCGPGDVGKSWPVTARSTSGRTVAFTITGRAPTPPPTTVAPTPPPALTVSLSENPYVCDNGVRQMGTIGNAAAGESIGFTSPGLSLLSGAANGAGQLSIKWQCGPGDVGKSWPVTARSTSGRTVAFTITGRAPTPPPTTVAPPPPPVGGSLAYVLTENPFVCNGTSHGFGKITGANPGETITFTAPGVSGLLNGAANAAGELNLIWQCNAGEGPWQLTARGSSSGKTVTVPIVGTGSAGTTGGTGGTTGGTSGTSAPGPFAASSSTGFSTNTPHGWGPCVAQDYNGGNWGWFIRVGSGSPTYTVRHGMLEGYLAAGRGAEGSLGCPTSDEYPYGSGARQDFQNGTLEWRPGMRGATIISGLRPTPEQCLPGGTGEFNDWDTIRVLDCLSNGSYAADFSEGFVNSVSISVHAYQRNGRNVVGYTRYKSGLGELSTRIPAAEATFRAKWSGRAFILLGAGLTFYETYQGSTGKGAGWKTAKATLVTVAAAGGGYVGARIGGAGGATVVAAATCGALTAGACLLAGGVVVGIFVLVGGVVGGVAGNAAAEKVLQLEFFEPLGYVPSSANLAGYA
jgi:LGFP repeat